jgi:hypothetical protein
MWYQHQQVIEVEVSSDLMWGKKVFDMEGSPLGICTLLVELKWLTL